MAYPADSEETIIVKLFTCFYCSSATSNKLPLYTSIFLDLEKEAIISSSLSIEVATHKWSIFEIRFALSITFQLKRHHLFQSLLYPVIGRIHPANIIPPILVISIVV